MRRSWLVAALVMLCAGAAASSPVVGVLHPARVDRVLESALAENRGGTLQIIVRAKANRLADVRSAVQAAGGTVVSELPIVDAVVARVTVAQLRTLRQHESVASISSDGSVATSAFTVAARSKVRVTTPKTAATSAKSTSTPTATTTTGAATAVAKTPTVAVPTTGGTAIAATKSAAALVLSDATTTTLGLLQTLGTMMTSLFQYSDLLPHSHLYRTLGITDMALNGTGVGIAIVDSGLIQDIGAVGGFYDFTNGLGGVATTPYDDYGHGTHVAGQIADSGLMSLGNYGGLAPGARLIGLKVLDQDGVGQTSDVIAAIEFAITNRAKLGIDIINLSLGHPIWEPMATDPLVQAVEKAAAAGIVVVASAGNNGMDPLTGKVGYAGIASPGNAPSALTIGAVDTLGTDSRTDDVVAAFSSRGPTWYDGQVKPDLVAPGRRKIEAVPAASVLAGKIAIKPLCVTFMLERCYVSLSGTSMATAVATGAVARMIQANRLAMKSASTATGIGAVPTWTPSGLTPNAVKAILQYTATVMKDANGREIDVLTQGAGELNAAGAAVVAALVNPAAPADTAWLRGPMIPQTAFPAETLAWGQRLVWGDRIVWGDQVPLDLNVAVWGQRVVWGDRIVWTDAATAAGQNPVQGDRVVWGDRLVWGERLVWGDSTVWGTTAEWGDRIVWGEDTALTEDNRVVWGDLAKALGEVSKALSAVSCYIEP